MTRNRCEQGLKMLLDYAAANSGYEIERSLSSSNGTIQHKCNYKNKA
jgi:hypothetical protein